MEEPQSERTLKEKIIDKLLLLYLLNRRNIGGRTKLQKTVFFAEDHLVSTKVKAFNYHFYRYHYGQFSKQLAQDVNELEENDFILKGSTIITARTQDTLERAKGVLSKNIEILKKIDMFADYSGPKSLDEVKTAAYTKVMRGGIQIRDIPEGTPLLYKISEDEAKVKFNIDEGWLGTLEILFDKNSTDSLRKALTEKVTTPFKV